MWTHHFDTVSFCRQIILLIWSFVNECHFVFWHFANRSFCQPDILKQNYPPFMLITHNLSQMLIGQPYILLTHHFANQTLNKTTILLKHYFANLTFSQMRVFLLGTKLRVGFISHIYFFYEGNKESWVSNLKTDKIPGC